MFQPKINWSNVPVGTLKIIRLVNNKVLKPFLTFRLEYYFRYASGLASAGCLSRWEN